MATTNMTSSEAVAINARLDGQQHAANVDFVLTMGIIVFLMQGGFALLEAGAVRSKNTVNIIIKNMLDCLIGGIAYWAIGWAVAYGPGGNAFIGGSQFFGYGLDPKNNAKWFFQYTFAATTATIVSGSIAERCQFVAYFIYSAAITGFIYPVMSHWAWDPLGWSFNLKFHDFAGSCTVHVSAGLSAIIATYFMGPRLGRFTPDGRPREMAGHSVPMAALGGFILLFGFLAFNGGSQGAIASLEDAEIVSNSVVVTIMAGCSGGLVVLFVNKIMIGHKWSFLMCLNGTLGGMVAICSGCDVYRQWSAVVIGVIGGLCTLGTHFAMLKLKLDDPLDAVAVHLGAGIPGFLLPAFFAQGEGIFWKGDTAEAWTQLGVNVGCGLVVVAWTCFWCILIFGSLNFFNMLRIDRDTEVKGVDLIKHGESAYPALAWVEAQYNIKTIVDGRDDTKDIPMYMTSPKNDSKKPKENNDSGVDNSAYL